MKRLLSGLMAILVVLSLCAGCAEPTPTTGHTNAPSSTTTVPTTTAPDPQTDYANSTVVLYTVNIRGDLTVYSQIAAVRAYYEALGADVLLVDAGNYLQGSAYANYDMGATVYQIMDAAGYDVAGMGIYDFVHGEAEVGYAAHGDRVKYYIQAELYRGAPELTYRRNAEWHSEPIYSIRAARAAATFRVLCSNLQAGENATGYYAFESSAVLGEGLKVGFLSVLSEDAAERIHEDFLEGYSFCDAVAPECDVLVSLGGNQGDIVIDIPADGSFAAGAYVIDHATKSVSYETVVLDQRDEAMDARIAALAAEPVIGVSAVELVGSRQANQNGQTNLGTLVAEALKWYAENKLEGIEYPVIGLFNGGNCRNYLYDGEITQTDIRNALHGSADGVGVVYLTGEQLLEVLEAATQRENCPGWAQVCGISYSVDTQKAYDLGAAYGLYYKAESINRVSVLTEDFDRKATYAVVTDMLLLKGEDTYYLLAQSEIAVRDQSGADVCQIVAMYIQEALAGRIGG